MAFVASDWSIERSTKNIRYIGDAHTGASPSYAKVIELHRALMDFADDELDSGDDELSMFDEIPSQRGGVDVNITLLNGYNIDDASAEHLYDGSITQLGGTVIYDGIQVFGNASSIQVIQNGAVLANDFWNEANMRSATQDAASSTTHRFLVKVRDAGADVDGRRLVGTQRVLGTVYTEFAIGGGTNRGNNVLALTANPDNNNQTSAGTIATWTDITNTNEGYIGIDANGDSINEFYYSRWDLGSRSKNQFFERMKWLTTEGTSSTLYGLSGEVFRGVTHEIDIDTVVGTFIEPEEVSWSTGTGQLLAISSSKAWIQLLTGVAPSDNTVLTGVTSAATCQVNVTVVSRTISTPFIGASTGSAILGAFGVGIASSNLGAADSVVDLSNTTNQPPNNVVFTVSNLDAGEDRVLVGPESAGSIDLNQMLLSGTLNTAAVTSITMSSSIPSDTPSSGTIFVGLDSGRYIPINYTSYSGATFTVASTDFSSTPATTGNGAFVAYINELASSNTVSFTTVYDADRTLVVHIRDGGVTPKVAQKLTATLGSGGGSVASNPASDE